MAEPGRNEGDSAGRIDSLIERAVRLLEENDAGEFTKPSVSQYPHQWNWDSAFIAIGLSHVDPERAWREIRSLLRGQWARGMIPHIIYPHGGSSYFPTPGFWQTGEAAGGIPVETSGLTQPPVLATAVRLLAARSGAAGRGLLEETYPALLAWHRWLHQARDPEGTGLVAIIHPWESGTDNSTRFTAPLENLGTVTPPVYARRDQRFVDADERPLGVDYDRFMHLIGVYRGLGWDDEETYAMAPFLVQDVLFNSILYRADSDLRALAEQLGESTAEIDAWQAAARRGFEERFRDEATGLYFDWDLRGGRQIRESSCASLMPLWSGAVSSEQVERLVREHLLDTREYAPGQVPSGLETRYFLPSASKSSRYFEPRRYWRGPVWINVNWLLVGGLEQYGYHREAAVVRNHTLELVDAGFAEYYDPRDGSARGASGFSWSAALAIDLSRGEPPPG